MKLIALEPAREAEDGRWRRVAKIPKTLDVKVRLRSGRVLKGSIREAAPHELAFVEGRNLIRIDLDDVAKITAMSRLDGALLGALFGFAIGGAFYAVTGAVMPVTPATALAGAVFGIVGAAAGHERTLYMPKRARKGPAAAVAAALSMLLAMPAPAAERPSRWDRVSEIPKTLNVKVHLRSGKVLKGTIQETAPDGLALVEDRNVIHVDREDIAEITTKSRARGALIGGVTGFAIAGGLCAAAAGYIADKNNPTATDRLGGLAICGGLAGGVLAAVGAASGSEKTLYTPERVPGPAAAPDR